MGVTTVPVDAMGMVSVDDVVDAVQPETVLVSIMLANNEVGVLEPVKEIARAVHACFPDVIVHTDAAQAVGKVPVDVRDLDVDLLTFAAHKLYGPKGVGAIFIRQGTEIDSLVHGSNHECGRRAGTENTAGIVGIGVAARMANECLPEAQTKMCGLRNRLQQGLIDTIAGLVINGHPLKRLPNTLNISCPGVTGSALLEAAPGIAASTGSACHSASTEPSTVLMAMGIAPDVAAGAVRLSIGRYTTKDEVDQVIAELSGAAELLAP